MGNDLEPDPGGEAVTAAAERMFVFRAGGRRYAVPVGAVLAVVGAGAGVRYRGRDLAAADAAALGLADEPRSAEGPAVVLGRPDAPRALRVDAIEGIAGGLTMRRWPGVLAALVGPFFPGIATGWGEPLIVVDALEMFAARDAADGQRHEEAEEGA